MSSMETISRRALLVTAVAPIAWGTTYLVTAELLPPDRPLFASVVRALPAGLLLLAFRRRLPHGVWWWRAVALGLCNIGLFFPLLFLAAYELPGGLASTLQATSPLAGVLAFVDVGDAKATDCGPVLSGASARAQRTTKGEPRDDVGRGTTATSEDGSRKKGERKEQRKKFLGIF